MMIGLGKEEAVMRAFGVGWGMGVGARIEARFGLGLNAFG